MHACGHFYGVTYYSVTYNDDYVDYRPLLSSRGHLRVCQFTKYDIINIIILREQLT